MQFLKDLITEKDGISFCPVRTGFWIALFIYTGGILDDWIHIANYVFSDHAKDIADGYKSIVGFGGLAVAGKNFTESSQ